jgi:hypothetical protein
MAAYVSQLIARIIDLGARWLGGWGSVQAKGLVSPLKPGAPLLQQTWQDMQGELSGLSSNTTRLAAPGGHMFPIEQPELVVNAIIDLVEQNR